MTARLPVLSSTKIIKALSKQGFRVVRQRGSHIKLKKTGPNKNLIVTVPDHKEVSPGVILNILKQAEMTREEFLKLLK